MMSSEFSFDKLRCTEHATHRDNKSFVYKYKYFGKANGIVNITASNDVFEAFISVDDNISKCGIIPSKVGNGGFLTNSELPIDLDKCKKFNLAIRSRSHPINPPTISIVCEYTHTSSTVSKAKSIRRQNSSGFSPSSVPLSNVSFGSPLNTSHGIMDIFGSKHK